MRPIHTDRHSPTARQAVTRSCQDKRRAMPSSRPHVAAFPLLLLVAFWFEPGGLLQVAWGLMPPTHASYLLESSDPLRCYQRPAHKSPPSDPPFRSAPTLHARPLHLTHTQTQVTPRHACPQQARPPTLTLLSQVKGHGWTPPPKSRQSSTATASSSRKRLAPRPRAARPTLAAAPRPPSLSRQYRWA
jgi:hypothetical protein